MINEEEVRPTSAVTSARELLVLGQRLKTMSVLKARLVHEASWGEVAEALGMDERTARRVYEDAEQRWRQGDLTPWLPRTERPGLRPLLRRIRGDQS
jgi:hypothetical protein